MAEVARAINDAMRLGAVSFDAVEHLRLCRIERRLARRDLEKSPHLPAPQVATTAVADYLCAAYSGKTGSESLLMETPQVLLEHHLKTLRLSTFLRE
jgi:hypothetical protein